MNTTTTFWLGSEQLLESKHIGAIIMVDHFHATGHKKGDDPFWESKSLAGRLAAFIEDRGQETFEAGERPNDIGSFPDYTVTIIFEHGDRITVKSSDTAQITVYTNEASA